tara:strand:- start:133 stop:420 length:288 start_codon:yes stop_codon:yes gene_type:complete
LQAGLCADALVESIQFRVGETFLEFRLAGQEESDQRATIRIQVGESAKFLQYGDREPVCFINGQQHTIFVVRESEDRVGDSESQVLVVLLREWVP